jgi:hypothetical protein
MGAARIASTPSRAHCDPLTRTGPVYRVTLWTTARYAKIGRVSDQKAPGPWGQYKTAPRPVKYGLPVLIVILILGLANSGSSSKTAATTVTSASVTCGPGTRLSDIQCVATASKARVVVHTHTVTQTITVTVPAASPAPAATAPASAPSASIETVGSLDHSTDAEFCAENTCIGNFTGEGGTIVECSDGTYSHAGGISGACSSHGGEM